MLQEQDFAREVLPAARAVSWLADCRESEKAAAVGRDATRNGHRDQRVATGPPAGAGAEIWDRPAEEWTEYEKMLAAGAVVVSEIRKTLADEVGFEASGGVASNKLLAKLGCGLHKPNQQTLVLPQAVSTLMRPLPLDRVGGLGGKFGEKVKSTLGVETCGEVIDLGEKRVVSQLGEQGRHLLQLCRGWQVEAVQDRELVKAIQASKTFFGASALRTVAEVEHWIGEITRELLWRMEIDRRRHRRAPTRIGISFGVSRGGSHENFSRQCRVDFGWGGNALQMKRHCVQLFQRWLREHHSSEELPEGTSVGGLGCGISEMRELPPTDGGLSKWIGKQRADSSGDEDGSLFPSDEPRQKKPCASKRKREAPDAAAIDVDAEPCSHRQRTDAETIVID
eukprot:TRINITY_DN10865_c0_g1_i2.p1 TRINITY_DN10865_c0_g1~~TRINITY_DN10865_c0_g1_i2.p1  ORF type:complete len:395 (+),score=130.48 TRINITY_DN10865_c0_g1_i2:611-1795(+)